MTKKRPEDCFETSFFKDDHNRIIRVAVSPRAKVEVHMLVRLGQVCDDTYHEDEYIWVPLKRTVPRITSDVEAPDSLKDLRAKNTSCPSFIL